MDKAIENNRLDDMMCVEKLSATSGEGGWGKGFGGRGGIGIIHP